MQIITPAQCRAARALLNWSQPELAERCNIHVQTISNFEKESSTPSKTTLEKIFITLITSGVAFTDQEGVKKSDGIVTILEGEDCFKQHLDTIYHDLKDKPGSEILISGLSEAKPEDKRRKFVENHIIRLEEAGIKERLLIKEGDNNLIAKKDWYRHLPEKYFATTTFQLHENKLALHEGGPTETNTPSRIIVIENKFFAESYRRLFNFAWDNAKPLK